MRKIRQYLALLRKVDIWQFVYLNYFCRSVIRTDNSRILPYKHSVVDIAAEAKIYLCGGDLEIGCDSLRRSKAETRVRLRERSVWSSEGGCRLSYGVTLELLADAVFDSHFYTMNSNSTMVAAKRVSLGEDVMIARNVVIYDSDFHGIINEEGNVTNPPKPVVIGDHVWLGTNAMVLKGACIGSNSIVAAGTIVRGSIDDNTIYTAAHNTDLKSKYGRWRREKPL